MGEESMLTMNSYSMEDAAAAAISPKRPRATEAAHALLLQARALLESAGEAEASSHLLDACIASLDLELRPPPRPPVAALSAMPHPSPQRSQETQTQSSLWSQQNAGTQADGPKSTDAASQVVPSSASQASQAVVMQTIATTQSGAPFDSCELQLSEPESDND